MAKKREAEGLPDIYNFLINKSFKSISELLEMTWRLNHAPAVEERERMNRMDVVLSYLDKPCIDGCNGAWIESALEVLAKNDINSYVFADAIRRCLTHGRKKSNNVILTGPTNCGKSFLLNPLEHMFKCFMNPAAGKYAWIGLELCEIAFLNDLRWTEDLIRWNDFLLLLEGQTVHLPRPKNQFISDLVIEKDNILPFFATSKSRIEFVGRFNATDKKETDMMDSRWKNFEFTKQIDDIKDIKECTHCFAVLATRGMR